MKPLVLAACFASAVWAADWPQFRGPNRDNVWSERGLFTSFPTNGLKIAWRANVGYGWASPVVANGRVYIFDAELTKPTARERLHCFDEDTGKLNWTFTYEAAYPEWAFVPGQGNGPTATPIVDRNRIYLLGALGDLHCLEARSGKVIWQRKLQNDFKAPAMSTRPSPLIEGNRLILFTGAKPGASVMALDKRTGKEIWKALDETVSNSSTIVIACGGVRQLIVWSCDSVLSMNPKTGGVYWRESMTTSNNDAIPTPVFRENRLLVGGLMFELDANRPAAKILWPDSKIPARRILSNTCNGEIAGSYVYSARSNGELVCLEAATGQLVWVARDITAPGNGASIHITVAGSHGYLFSDQGELTILRLGGEKMNFYDTAKLIEPTTPFGSRKRAWTPPAYANGRVIARTDAEVVSAWLRDRR